MATQKEKATAFRKLHHSDRILVLPNAWDVSSALIFEEAGFPAVATTSGGVAASLGYEDGERISRDEMLTVVGRIARSVSVPVSADMEAGYGSAPGGASETARRLIDAGAVGINIEDMTRIEAKPLAEVERQADTIRAIRAVADASGVPLFINARTDASRFSPGSAGEKLEEVIRRGKAYSQAGADCIFVFGVHDAESISKVVSGLACPVNVIAGQGSPTIAELQKLGVARVTFGSGPARVTLGLLRRVAKELIAQGTYESLTNGAVSAAEMNKLVARHGER